MADLKHFKKDSRGSLSPSVARILLKALSSLEPSDSSVDRCDAFKFDKHLQRGKVCERNSSTENTSFVVNYENGLWEGGYVSAWSLIFIYFAWNLTTQLWSRCKNQRTL